MTTARLGEGRALFAWGDTVASEARIHATTYGHGAWGPTTTVAASLERLSDIPIRAQHRTLVRWRVGFHAHAPALIELTPGGSPVPVRLAA